MTYQPKHRGEPRKMWVVSMVEYERGWGQNHWNNEFDNEAEAIAFFEDNQPKPGPTPDYYIIATDIKEVTI